MQIKDNLTREATESRIRSRDGGLQSKDDNLRQPMQDGRRGRTVRMSQSGKMEHDSQDERQEQEPRDKHQKQDQQEERQEREEQRSDRIKETGQVTLDGDGKSRIHLMTIIGEIEGHENAVSGGKATKYDHILPELAAIEDSSEVDGLLILLNTAGGDIDAGLAIAEMIASLSKPTVSLVLGGSHSIGVPLAVASDYSFIVPTGTMLVHPVRMTGMIIGAPQTYEYFKRMQDRITGFIASHSRASQEKLEQMMMNTGELTKDLGTILIGENAVKEGLIDEVGGIREALKKLHGMIEERKKGKTESHRL